MIHRNVFFKSFYLLLLIAMVVLACKKEDGASIMSEEEETVESTEKEEILFIGNSHTYFNRGISDHLASFRSHDDLDFTPIMGESAKGGYTLNDHLNDPQTSAKIKERRWDVMVLQENTFVAAEERQETIDAMVALNDMVAGKGTKVFLFMTWPYEDQPEMFAAIKRTYTKSASAASATIVDVGEDWRAINAENPHDINLYSDDGVHPSIEGTYYATAKFYRAIYNKLPSSNDYQAGLPPIVATYLKEQAD